MLDQVVLFQLLFRSKYCFIYEKAIRINVRTADVHRGALLVFAFVILINPQIEITYILPRNYSDVLKDNRFETRVPKNCSFSYSNRFKFKDRETTAKSISRDAALANNTTQDNSISSA